MLHLLSLVYKITKNEHKLSFRYGRFMQERERERDVVAGTFGSSEERTREGNVIAGRLDVEWMVKRCSPREKNEKGGRGERKVDKKGASRRGKKGRRRKLRGGSNHRRILWDHNSGCCRYHRAVEVLEDSFLPSIHPLPFSPFSFETPRATPRSFTADSTRLPAIEIVSRPAIVLLTRVDTRRHVF